MSCAAGRARKRSADSRWASAMPWSAASSCTGCRSNRHEPGLLCHFRDASRRCLAPDMSGMDMSGNALRQELLEPLDDAGDRLAEADAHARDPVACLAALELVEQRRCHPRARRAE